VKDQFDVWRLDFPGKGEHPVVLVSHPDLCSRAVVNVLYCTSQRQGRQPKPFEVMLNGADGMDWETFCDCSILYSVPSAALFGKRGRVSMERRRAIRAKIRDVFRLAATD
jgi:mRNA-degrading endonuclease toxin of MazEF toxin-antitoxin module